MANKKILIVEDDRRLARQVQKGLEEQCHSVTAAFDGNAGLDAARHGQFDVLLLDVMLPGIDGLTIVKRVRAAGVSTPILLLTARDSADDVITGLDAGADDYLTKPFSHRELIARIRAQLRRSSKGRDSRVRPGVLFSIPRAAKYRWTNIRAKSLS